MADSILALGANFQEIYEIISTKFKNVAVFDPINDFDGLKNTKKAFENGSEREFFKSAVNEFDRLAKSADFVLVKPAKSIASIGEIELNLQIARNLNVPVFCRENLSFFTRNSKLIVSGNLDEILNANQDIITPLRFENSLFKLAAKDKKTVVLPESEDERILGASEILLKSGAVNLILLGDENKVKFDAEKLGVNLNGARFINLEKNEYTQRLTAALFEARKSKGVSLEQARELVRDRTYFATMMVQEGLADAMVSGANTTTAHTIRPALQIIKTRPDSPLVSSSFIMCFAEEILIYADCAINPNPDARQLAQIALASADTARAFGLEPRVAMLSYSSGDSGSGADIDLVRSAGEIAHDLAPALKIEAPVQYDAAIDPVVARKKLPNSDVAGRANVFVFPNLNAGNIGYKIAQRSANCLAVGPILQGLKKPVNDLSRGCGVGDVVNTVLISAIQAANKGEK
ncbi:phosphate acetyltransferase [Campylobacter showae]|uniref:phosphate acetyltransferase n=1 Tax=Campylobacter showae TaxID=204 RepID=UPI0028D8CD95|nr:phosphate acetyltransferase [Campylobacter showae]